MGIFEPNNKNVGEYRTVAGWTQTGRGLFEMTFAHLMSIPKLSIQVGMYRPTANTATVDLYDVHEHNCDYLQDIVGSPSPCSPFTSTGEEKADEKTPPFLT